MRLGTVNGNGAICDICGKKLVPCDVIKLKALQLSSDPSKSSTGHYVTLRKMDCCIDCYNQYFENLMSRPRKELN